MSNQSFQHMTDVPAVGSSAQNFVSGFGSSEMGAFHGHQQTQPESQRNFLRDFAEMPSHFSQQNGVRWGNNMFNQIPTQDGFDPDSQNQFTFVESSDNEQLQPEDLAAHQTNKSRKSNNTRSSQQH